MDGTWADRNWGCLELLLPELDRGCCWNQKWNVELLHWQNCSSVHGSLQVIITILIRSWAKSIWLLVFNGVSYLGYWVYKLVRGFANIQHTPQWCVFNNSSLPQSPTSVVLTDRKRTVQILRAKTLRVLTAHCKSLLYRGL